MTFSITDHLIPIKPGHSVSRGWRKATDHRPMGVTWHWTAVESLAVTTRILGGNNAQSKGVSSAHYGIGRSFAEGIDRYVTLENQSWHAGKNQKMIWDGTRSRNEIKGSRSCIGIETCNLGYARSGHPAGPDWIRAVNTDSKWEMQIQPWTEEQFEMMIFVGREIRTRWPHIPYQHHHGHHDICPGYKQDVAGFPFAALLRVIYDDPTIPDIWTPLWNTIARQRVLIKLGYDLGNWKDDGDWGEWSQRALTRFQKDTGAVQIPHWTTFTCRDAHTRLTSMGHDLEKVANTPA